MAKNKENNVESLLSGMKKTAKKEEVKVKKNTETKEKSDNIEEQTEEIKAKSTRGRKKKTNVKRVVKGNKITYIKENEVPLKANKTFYLSTSLVEELDKMAEMVGLSTSELMEDAIQLLINNSTLKGFNNE